MGQRHARGALPGWVVATVVATFLGCWYLGVQYVLCMSPLVRAVVSFLVVGLLGTAARYLAVPRPVVFVQDILAELAVYAVAGLACGAAIEFLAIRWGVAVAPVWPALAVYISLTFLFDRQVR